eukprot:CAMPEP_0195103844 /NCGR_PEP_ID=MMETSP0448-20130528/72753_1 /TAXON_ID=66468 /ORGANISM="Heterocapsa triquestra, Strain CCMP 448" /LENGTH=258 /DNA_ID=CAMNT_0040139593 /DNA_START=65 /DNA_END=839 /DNA_ORIENTATION=+
MLHAASCTGWGKPCIGPRPSAAYGSHEGPATVTLHIYDAGTSGIVRGLNTVLRPLGSGAFHCGVEVYDLEWSYSDTSCFSEDPGVTGLFFSWPKKCEGHSYTESVHMGKTVVSEMEVMRIVEELEAQWLGESYDLLEKNCCHFCNLFCDRLGVGRIPDWVMNLANTGASVGRGCADLVRARRTLTNMVANVMQTMCMRCCIMDGDPGVHVEVIESAVRVSVFERTEDDSEVGQAQVGAQTPGHGSSAYDQEGMLRSRK